MPHLKFNIVMQSYTRVLTFFYTLVAKIFSYVTFSGKICKLYIKIVK